MRIIPIVLVACLIALAQPVAAQLKTLPSGWQEDGPEQHAETVLDGLVRGDNDEAFDLFFSKGRYPKNTLEKIRFDYFQVVKQQGQPSAWEKIFEQRAGTSIRRLKYVLLFKSTTYMFDLYYYNTGKDWLLKSFTLSKDIKKVFDQ